MCEQERIEDQSAKAKASTAGRGRETGQEGRAKARDPTSNPSDEEEIGRVEAAKGRLICARASRIRCQQPAPCQNQELHYGLQGPAQFAREGLQNTRRHPEGKDPPEKEGEAQEAGAGEGGAYLST